jgi:hypothetical protein
VIYLSRQPTSKCQIAMVAFNSFGVSIAVECRPGDALAVSNCLPPGCKPVNPAETEHRFTFEPEPEQEDLFSVRYGRFSKGLPKPLNSALRILQKEIYLCIAEHSRNYAFIHASVVAWNKSAIIFPGASHAGKSTLAWALVQAGAVYYSDEYAVLDEQGTIHPFALPINLRLPNGERRAVVPDCVGSDPLEPVLIVFARYQPKGIWRPHPLRPGESMLRLVQHSISIRSNSAFVLRILKEITSSATAYAGTRGDPVQMLEWISTQVGCCH